MKIHIFCHEDPAHEHRFYLLGKQMEKIMALIDDLGANVQKDTDATNAAITLLQNLKAQLDAAGTDPVKLKALSDTIGTNASNLAAAVTANTPAATPAPAPSPPPTPPAA